MKATYANVTSTIALFAALTTGTSYAATQLARDSVRSPHIRNGSVTLADLHPSVRARMTPTTQQRPTTGTEAGSLLPLNTWADTGALTATTWNDSSDPGPIVNLSSRVGTTGNVEFRLAGSITKPAGKVAQITFATVTPDGGFIHGWYAGTATAATIAGTTLDADAFGFGGQGTIVQPVIVPATEAARVVVYYTGEGATSKLRVQVRRIG